MDNIIKSEKISSPGMTTTFFGISKEHNVICEVNDLLFYYYIMSHLILFGTPGDRWVNHP